MIYVVEDEAKWIDDQLFKSSFSKFKYISFKLSSSAARLAAMHTNEMINVKSRFETLCEVNRRYSNERWGRKQFRRFIKSSKDK